MINLIHAYMYVALCLPHYSDPNFNISVSCHLRFLDLEVCYGYLSGNTDAIFMKLYKQDNPCPYLKLCIPYFKPYPNFNMATSGHLGSYIFERTCAVILWDFVCIYSLVTCCGYCNLSPTWTSIWPPVAILDFDFWCLLPKFLWNYK